MPKLNIAYLSGLLLVVLSSACLESHPEPPETSHLSGAAEPVRTVPVFPFPYRVDPETCAQDEAIDIERALDSLCGPRTHLDHAGSLAELSAACQIDGKVLISCELPKSGVPSSCSNTVYTKGQEGPVGRVVLAQTDSGRIPPPTHPSSHGACGSILESLSKELYGIAERQGRHLNLSDKMDVPVVTQPDSPNL